MAPALQALPPSMLLTRSAQARLEYTFFLAEPSKVSQVPTPACSAAHIAANYLSRAVQLPACLAHVQTECLDCRILHGKRTRLNDPRTDALAAFYHHMGLNLMQHYRVGDSHVQL